MEKSANWKIVLAIVLTASFVLVAAFAFVVPVVGAAVNDAAEPHMNQAHEGAIHVVEVGGVEVWVPFHVSP